MAIQQRRFGEVTVTSIMDVEGELAFGDMFDDGSAPPLPAEEMHRAFPAEYSSTGWRFLCRCFLIQAPGPTVLVDLGVGPAGSPASAWMTTPGWLMDGLKDMGVAPEQIDHVVITHHHDDHTGWATVERDGELVPTFPSAVYHLHLADVLGLKDSEDADARALYRVALEPVERTGQLNATDTDDQIAPGMRLMHTPGHTPGHRCLALTAGDQELLLAGDLLHFTHQMDGSGWKSPLDTDPEQAIRTRDAVLSRAQQDGTVLASTHLPFDFCRIVEGAQGRTLEES